MEEDATENDNIDPRLISRLIKGEPNGSDEKIWMFEIIANKRNSFDVDKLDYLCRDNYHVGLNHQGNQDKINHEILFQSARVIENKLAYSIKVVNTVKMVYDLRFEMFRAIYNHKVAQAIDLMMRDALVAADCHFDFLSNLRNPAIYRNYTDSIVKRIERNTKDPKLK